ncbi:MAG: HAD family hydrolase [Bacteroidales bacterium]|nr:HAD family hydrolase [Bacteroidales bacterium]
MESGFKVENIIFDFDGTLADTSQGIIASVRALLDRLGLEQTSEAQIKSAIGLPLARSLHLGGNIPMDNMDYVCDLYHEIFNVEAPKYISLFEGVRETLGILQDRGMGMAVATSRGTESLNRLLNAHGIAGFFSICVTANDVRNPKPAPDAALMIMDKMGWKAGETLVVGDTTYDIEMGRAAGCHTLAVTYGNHPRETILSAGPEHLADRFEDILPCLGRE